ncbi:hypothetical protein [Bradyrhizobium sp. LHD-71]|uniref:hypothetical protein n=1 Tax=Bradyrhizobium sp. LHD-71 TaxID=3072141 RepID=UPI00280CFA00|nr:hypothetical protein [Bradyrhizobium sp. LHD-71]MDQ8731067.1 hypothetical protein [Bradyrhizobium sp. LHD-71]
MQERELLIGNAFRWRPGEGPDITALERMHAAFPRPAKPMGEAWFMSKTRHMFTNLMGDIDAVPVNEFEKALEEIAGGTSSFGPYDEWREWFHYLLPRLVLRANESDIWALNELLVTGFMTQYPSGVADAPYPAFREDVLNTLGRTIMDRNCWRDGNVVLGTLLRRHNRWPSGLWGWNDASGDLSAALFFNIKYLPEESLRPWMTSVLSIACPYWRAQLIAWFVGAHDVLTGQVRQPPDFTGDPDIDWEWSHCLKLENLVPGESSFFPEPNCRAVLEVLAATMTEDVFLQWLLSVAEKPDLEAELFDLPDRFSTLYL